MAPKITTLNSEQLRKLAKVMFYKGAEAIYTIKFRSEFERAQFLKSCKSAYEDTISLIDTTESTIEGFQDDPRMAPLVYDYACYVKDGVAFAYQGISLYSQRAAYLKELKTSATMIVKTLRSHKLVPLPEAELAQLAKDVSLLRKRMSSYLKASLTRATRRFPTASRMLGRTFANTVLRCQAILRHKGRFQRLASTAKAQVFDKVLESGGMKKLAKYGKTTVDVVDKYGTRAVFALTAFAAAIDIYAADPDQRYEVAVKNVIAIGSAFLIGEIECFIWEAVFALVATGQPPLIALGVALAVADIILGQKLQDFINDHVAPVIVDFMKDHKDEVDQVHRILCLQFPVLAAVEAVGFEVFRTVGAVVDFGTGKADLDDVLILLTRPLPLFIMDCISKYIDIINGTEKITKGEQQVPKPPPPLSTKGLIVRGPGVPNSKALVLQIASKEA